MDWPASTQAETYFAASPDAAPSNTAKRWLGTFVANGQGTTGMLYRRNRYFDPKSGQFTQADPANPDAYDTKDFLKNAPSQEVHDRIINGRIKHLEDEIRAIRRAINETAKGGP